MHSSCGPRPISQSDECDTTEGDLTLIDLRRGRQAVYRPSATAALTRSHALRVWALSAS